MLKLRKVLNQNLFQSLYRSYASIININADIVKSIKVKADEFEEIESDGSIKFEAIDGEQNLIKITDKIAKVTKTKDEFTLDWLDKSSDTSIIIEIPISSIAQDIEIHAKVQTSGQIKIDNIPTAKIVKASTAEGRVKLSCLRAERCEIIAPYIEAENVYSFYLDVKSQTPNEGKIKLDNCQADKIKAEAKSVHIHSCYATRSDIRTTDQSLLKNLHTRATIVASGEVLNTVGFAGSINAQVKCEHVMLHFAELVDNNHIEIDHPEAKIRAGFANEIIKESTNLHIFSNCPIETKSKEFVVCQRAENEFEVIRKNPNAESSLKMNVKRAKEFNLIKQSWIDSIKFG